MGERMTFDARKGKTAPASGQQNALFAVVTFVVVCGAFFAVLSLPRKAAVHMPKPAPVVGSLTPAALPRLPGEHAEAYYLALGRIDAKAQTELATRIARTGKADEVALAGLVMDHAGQVLRAHAGELAAADTKHVDRLLDLARDRLRTASQRRSKWCDAVRYADLKEIEFQDPAQLQQELAELQAPMREFAFEALTGLMVAVEDAREHPVERGALTRTDEAAIQGMMISLMADPDIMPLMVSLQSGADTKQALKGVNVCNVAATAISAVKTLPQDTKGRMLAEAMRNMEKNGPSAFTSGVSF